MVECIYSVKVNNVRETNHVSVMCSFILLVCEIKTVFKIVIIGKISVLRIKLIDFKTQSELIRKSIVPNTLGYDIPYAIKKTLSKPIVFQMNNYTIIVCFANLYY